MEIRILDKNFIAITIVENYSSFIWTDRYDECGDFELCGSIKENWISAITIGNYVQITESDKLMIIESFEITTDMEAGNNIRVTGRSLESILGRRIVWKQTIVSGSIQTIIKKIIDDAIINPEIPERRIPNFVFKESDDELINTTLGEIQYTGDTVLDLCVDLCMRLGVGFKITLNDNYEFVFELFRGFDRSDNIIFSTEYNNLISSDYINDYTDYYNVTLVAGEGEGSARKTVSIGDASGLERIELFTDARDLSSTGTTAANYLNQLIERGKNKLAEKYITEGFNGEVEPFVMYKYGVDYYIGDFVKIEDMYGNYDTPKVKEFIISDDESNGYHCYPTFVVEG